MKYILNLLFCCFSIVVFSQKTPASKKEFKRLILNDSTYIKNLNNTTTNARTTKARKNVKKKKLQITDYKIISNTLDTTYVDTSLTIYKEYKFNYLRKDYFDLLEFSNVGQTNNQLSYNFTSNKLLPLFNAQARHFNYFDIEDIKYYNVPTPLTELFFKTTFEQGQMVDALFTANTSPQLNISIGFKSLRSLGKYQNIRTNSRNFTFTTNYLSKNKFYDAKFHFASQGLDSEENGGLSDENILEFEIKNEEFDDRAVFDPLFENADNDLEGRRYFLDHNISIKDSLGNHKLALGNILSFEEKKYEFNQTESDSLFGEAFVSAITDNVVLKTYNAQAYLKYSNKILGNFKANVDYTDVDYGYDSFVELENQNVTNKIKDQIITAGGAYTNKIGKLKLNGDFGIALSGNLTGNYINANAIFEINKDWLVEAAVNRNSRAPNYNFLLNQSDYINYNWQNISQFNNVQTGQLSFKVKSKYIDVTTDYTTINNYTYFTKNIVGNVSPVQFNGTVNYFRLLLSNNLTHKKFALNNTFRYQSVLDGAEALQVPEINLRSTLYYTDRWFKKALFVQMGLTGSYFSSYFANAYDPLLAEFYVQDDIEIGDFPRLDFFLNFRVQQTRIFFKAEHFNSAFSKTNTFLSAPNYPYRDFVVRFGLVWNFFM